MSYALTVGSDGPAQTAQVVWSVDGKTYRFRSDNNFISWITTIFEVGDVASGSGTIDYRLLRPFPATQDATLGLNGNTGAGLNTLGSNTSGANNSAYGSGALSANTSGGANSAFGFGALDANLSGADNSAFGVNALGGNTTGSFNVALGTNSLLVNNGSLNVGVGVNALLANTSGDGNCAVGVNCATTVNTGSNNTILGNSANVDSGARNLCVCLGCGATSPASDGSLAIGGTGGNAMGNLVVGAAGIATGTFLNIYLNGAQYKIALLNP